MKNKRTVIFISDETRSTVAAAAKEYLAAHKDVLAVLLSERELENAAWITAEDFFYNKFKLLGAIKGALDGLKQKRNFTKAPLADDKFYTKKLTYRKMANVLTRYNPELLVLTCPVVINEAVAAKKELASNVKIVIAVDGYVLDKRYINKFADGYIVDNRDIAEELVKGGIAPEIIAVTGLPTRKAFLTDIEDVDCELNLDLEKPTLLIIRERGDNRFDPFRGRTDFNILDAKDDDKADLNLFFSQADIILTTPEPRTVAKALLKGKTLILYGTESYEQKKTAEYLSADFAIYCKSAADVQKTLDSYLTEDLAFAERISLIRAAIPTPPYERFGEEIIKTLGELGDRE